MRKRIGKFASYTVLSVVGVIMLFPVLWMVVASFEPPSYLYREPPVLIPHVFTFANYANVKSYFPFGLYLMNSALVVVCVTVGTVLISLITGYILAKHKFPGRQIIFILFVATMFVPFQIMVVPLFVVVHQLGWENTYAALIVPPLVSGFGILICRQYIATIPDDLIEATRIDGGGEFRIIFRIMAPIAAPALSAISIFTFLSNWDSLLWPVIAVSSESLKTLPMGIAGLALTQGTQFNLLLAAATLSTVPVLIVFLIFQRNFVEGVALSGIKG